METSSNPAETTAPAASESTPAATGSTSKLTLTAKAIAQVKDVMKSQKFEGYFLTVRVVPAGCSGLGYDLNVMKESKPGDLIWEQDGVKICTDPVSSNYLAGTEVDYQKTEMGAGFKFSNPNAKSSCGCGTSFST
ncbi:MAG: HesB/YadR/YfhF family protein [Myxococcaceae bacterium]|nr:HesB/YadR/YfhF family protein [Myxococcaceae bacterium]